MPMRILVIGGTGFLGQHIAAELRRRGSAVAIMARRAAPGDEVVVGDVARLAHQELVEILRGYSGIVFAAGADDRHVPPAPAARYFHDGNVAPVRRLIAAARETQCRRIVICGSYFTAINDRYPDWRLPEHHPYIHSRVRQAEVALDAAKSTLSTAVLEIPPVFGGLANGQPLWAPLVPWISSRFPLLAPPGGTAAAAVDTIAQAAVEALEQGATGRFPIADENLSWADLLGRLASATGRTDPVRVRHLPLPAITPALRALSFYHRLGGRESGLDLVHATQLFTSELHLDPTTCRSELGVRGGDLDQAFRDTITAAANGRTRRLAKSRNRSGG